MSGTLRVVPTTGHTSTISSTANNTGAPSVRSVPDTLRSQTAPHSVSTFVNSRHPLEARLKGWDETQHNLKMESLKRLYGAAEPIKRSMEVKMCADYVPAQLGGASNLHKDILEGKDESCEWEDVFKGNDNIYDMPNFHSELEARCRMNW